jgi:hypothetical protein
VGDTPVAQRDLSEAHLRVVPTPPALARAVCRLARHALQQRGALPSPLRLLDPACGEGDMLRAASIVFAGHDLVLAGVEAQRARLTPTDLPPATRLHHGDALLAPPELWRSLAPGGRFECVAGNPPFVRHEAIRDPVGEQSPAAYREALRTAMQTRMPGTSPNGRADLALLFTLLGLSLLTPDGVLAFVLPTAVVEAQYGAALREALAAGERRAIFVESDAVRPFGEAVNVGVLIAGRCIGGAAGMLRRERFEAPLDTVDPDAVLQPRSSASRQHAYLTVPLGTFGRVRYPVKTGLNAFFYPDAATIARFGIEERWLRPVIRSPREIRRIAQRMEETAGRLFVCPLTEDMLERDGAAGALRYVRWGAQRRTPSGVLYPEVPSLRGRTPWYAVGVPQTADILLPRFVDRRYLFVGPRDPVIEDQTLYGLILHDRSQRDLLGAVLNSCLGHHALETGGRTGLGEGVRQFALCDMAELPVPDVRCIRSLHRQRILARYLTVAERRLEAVPSEYTRADRIALDAAVGDAFGLDDAALRAIRAETCALLDRRLRRTGRARLGRV